MDRGVAPEVRVYANPSAASAALARHLVRRAGESIRARGQFSLVLSGGKTPQALYRRLARYDRTRVPWRRTEVFFGDERCIGPRSAESNYRAASDSLLSRIPVPRRHVHRLEGELRPPTRAAERYAELLGAIPAPEDGPPRFDLVLLGIGGDGHTASLFPNSPALRARTRSVVAVARSPDAPFLPRLTLTYPALASSREVCFLVAGAEKADVLGKILRSLPNGTPRYPASLVRSRGSVVWFLDRAAASKVPTSFTTTPPSRQAPRLHRADRRRGPATRPAE